MRQRSLSITHMNNPVSGPLPERLLGLSGIDELRQAILSVCVNAFWIGRPKGDWRVVTPSTPDQNLLTVRPGKQSFQLVMLNNGGESDKQFRAYDSRSIESYRRRMRAVIRHVAPADENEASRLELDSNGTCPSTSASERPQCVRIVPMSPNDSGDCSIEKQQNDYFLGDLGGRLRGAYYCRSALVAEPETPVLFQYRGRIIAFARFVRGETLPEPSKDGYPKVMVFDPATIRIFAPVTAERMRKIWPGEFKKFTHTKPKLSLDRLDEFLAHVGPTVRAPACAEGTNAKAPGGWIGSTKTYVKNGPDAVEVSAEHNKLQTKLRDELIEEYGAPNVVTEQNHVDIRVTTADADMLFEIKPDPSPRAVIRQALGQLLEYAYLNPQSGCGRELRLVIVGRVRLGQTEKDYLDHLKNKFGLPLSYRVVTL